MSLRDTRNAPFCWQEKALLRQLRAYYSGDRLKRRTTAFAVYLVLTEIASDQYGQAQATAFVKEIGDRLGASETTVKDYLRDFETLGIVRVERRMVEERVNTANTYYLLTAPERGVGRRSDPPGRRRPNHLGRPSDPPGRPTAPNVKNSRSTMDHQKKRSGSPARNGAASSAPAADRPGGAAGAGQPKPPAGLTGAHPPAQPGAGVLGGLGKSSTAGASSRPGVFPPPASRLPRSPWEPLRRLS
jgi:hypothetical protein